MAAGHAVFSCRLSKVESYAVARSQELVFGSWEDREHGPSHSLGKRCKPSWAALDLPSFAEKAQAGRHTCTERLYLLFPEGAPGMPHMLSWTA